MLQTSLVNSFAKSEGFGALFQISSNLWTDEFRAVTAGHQVEADLAASIELMLSIMCNVSNSKLLLDSPFTATLVKDKVQGRSGVFDPHSHLVSLRTEILTHIKAVWENTLLAKCSTKIVKGVIQLLIHILEAEGEIRGPDNPVVKETVRNLIHRRPQPDEDRISQLMDMGFPRAAAEMALIRCNNSVARAAEYLLLNPHVVTLAPTSQSAPAAAAPIESAQTAESAQDVQTEPATAEVTGEDDEMEEASALNVVETTAGASSSSLEVKTVDNAERLKVLRAETKSGLFQIAFFLLSHVADVVFDVKELISLGSDIGNAVDFILIEIAKLQTLYSSQPDAHEVPLSRGLQLFALIVSDPPFERKAILKSQHFIESLLKLVESCSNSERKSPLFLSSVLLILQAYIILSDEIKPVALDRKPENGNYKDPEPLEYTIPLSLENKIHLVLCIKNILAREDEKDVIFALLQLLVSLTKNLTVAAEFVKMDGLVVLLKTDRIAQFSSRPVLTTMILRHIVENHSALLGTMEQEIKSYMKDSTRQKIVDINTYIRNTSHLAVRDPETYVNATKNLCQLLKFDHHGRQQVALKKVEPAPEAQEGEDNVMTETHSDVPSTELSETLSMFLVSEIMALKNSVLPDVDDAIHIRRCFLLQVLAELCSSYPAFKIDVLNASQRRGKQSTPHKTMSKNSFLSYLLVDLLPHGLEAIPLDLLSVNDLSQRKKYVESCRASAVLQGLCLFVIDPALEKKLLPETINARKSVFDAVARSIKEAISSTESAEVRFSRFFAISDLCLKMLSSQGVKKGAFVDEGILAVSKIMLEKNLVQLFTQMLNEIDIHHPSSTLLLNSVLRPLEILSKVAIKTGRHPDHKKKDLDSNSMGTDGQTEVADETQNAISEMYRNSALGLFKFVFILKL